MAVDVKPLSILHASLQAACRIRPASLLDTVFGLGFVVPVTHVGHVGPCWGLALSFAGGSIEASSFGPAPCQATLGG